jgi:hypothetical protein
MSVVPQHTAVVTVINQTNTWASTPSTPATEGPAISWTLRKSAGQEPNTAEITMYNLAPGSVAAITDLVETRIEFDEEQLLLLQAAGASTAPAVATSTNLGIASVRMEVGYTGQPLWLWYVGQSTKIETDRQNPETTLKLICADHGDMVGAGQIYPPKTYIKGSKMVDLVMDLIYAMGLSAEPADIEAGFAAAAAQLVAGGIAVASTTNFLAPYVSSGSARKQLDQIMSALNLTWMVLDGVFYLLTPKSVLPGYPPLVFKPADGTLIGSPRRVEGGALEVDTTLRPGLIPWRAAVVMAAGIETISYRIRAIEASGSTESGASATVTLEAIQTVPGVF